VGISLSFLNQLTPY